MFHYKKVEYLNTANNVLATAMETGFEEHLLQNQIFKDSPPRISVDRENATLKFVWKGDTTSIAFEEKEGYLTLLRKILFVMV